MNDDTTTIVSDTLSQLADSVYNLILLSSLDMLTDEEDVMVDKIAEAVYHFDNNWVENFEADLYMETDELLDEEDD